VLVYGQFDGRAPIAPSAAGRSSAGHIAVSSGLRPNAAAKATVPFRAAQRIPTMGRMLRHAAGCVYRSLVRKEIALWGNAPALHQGAGRTAPKADSRVSRQQGNMWAIDRHIAQEAKDMRDIHVGRRTASIPHGGIRGRLTIAALCAAAAGAGALQPAARSPEA
jgi:hypothetical protein